MNAHHPTALARALEDFFGNYLPTLRAVSPHTIRSYRDSLVLLLRFVIAHAGVPLGAIDLPHVTASRVLAFLASVEDRRRCTSTTRNVRLAAIHAFFRYLGAAHPEYLPQCQRILAVPFKRAQTRTIDYLEYEEIAQILASIDQTTLRGERDYALLATLFNTGARVQELLNVRVRDLQLDKPFQVRLLGKGRKERSCPLWPQTASMLHRFVSHRGVELGSEEFLFLNRAGQALTRFGVRYLFKKYLRVAQVRIPALAGKHLHPHSIRHSTAVALLKAGVDLTTIGQWLGHASPETTNKYASIDLDLKRKALARLKPPSTPGRRSWTRDSDILTWLEGL